MGCVFGLSGKDPSLMWSWCRFDRRFRIYEVSDYGETIRTYKRVANEEVVDEMALAGRGAPEPYVW